MTRQIGPNNQVDQGTRRLAAAYGGRNFAMEIKAMGVPGYDPGGSFGQGLSSAAANRGDCHLSAFMVGPEVSFHLLDPENPKAGYVGFFEALTKLSLKFA